MSSLLIAFPLLVSAVQAHTETFSCPQYGKITIEEEGTFWSANVPGGWKGKTPIKEKETNPPKITGEASFEHNLQGEVLALMCKYTLADRNPHTEGDWLPLTLRKGGFKSCEEIDDGVSAFPKVQCEYARAN